MSEIVGYQNHRHMVFAPQGGHQVVKNADALPVHRRNRLVKQQQVRQRIQGKGQQHRIACCPPDCGMYAAGRWDGLYQHRIDCNTDQDQESLEAKGEQGA